MKKIIFVLSFGLFTLIGASNVNAAENSINHDRHDHHHRSDRNHRHHQVKKTCRAVFKDSYGRKLDQYIGWDWVNRHSNRKSDACRYAMGKCLDDNRNYRTGSCTTSDRWVRYTHR